MPLRPFRLVLAAGLFGGIATGVIESRRWATGQWTASPCLAGPWTPPQRIVAMPAGTYLGAPSIATSGGTTLVAGTAAFTSLASRSPRTPGKSLMLIERGDGAAPSREISAPAGQFVFLNPRVIAGPHGLVHLVWGEPSGGGPGSAEGGPQSSHARVTALWHATYTRDGGWTLPVRIHADSTRRERLAWNDMQPAMAVDSRARLHVMIPGARSTLHLTYDGVSWTTRTMAEATTALGLAAGPRHDLVLVTMASIAPRRALFRQAGRGVIAKVATSIRRSTDDGEHWSEAHVLDDDAAAGSSVARVFVRDSIVHVLWSAKPDLELRPQAVSHVFSHDGGHHWSWPRSLRIPDAPFTRWSAALDACGTPTVVVSSWDRSRRARMGSRLQVSLRQVDAWAPLTNLTSDSNTLDGVLAQEQGGALTFITSAEAKAISNSVPSYEVIERRLDGKLSSVASGGIR